MTLFRARLALLAAGLAMPMGLLAAPNWPVKMPVGAPGRWVASRPAPMVFHRQELYAPRGRVLLVSFDGLAQPLRIYYPPPPPVYVPPEEAPATPPNTEGSRAFLPPSSDAPAPKPVVVPKPEAPSKAGRELVLLSIGVSEYPKQIGNVEYAADEARSVADLLQNGSYGIFEKVHQKVLTNKEATVPEVRKALVWLRRQMTQNDVAVVYVAGHGVRDGAKGHSLLLSDVDPDDMVGTGLPSTVLRGALEHTPGWVVLMVDACHAGAIAAPGSVAPVPITPQRLQADLAGRQPGLIGIFACQEEETAKHHSRTRSGYFTRALLDGLSGKADQDNDGVVNLRELNAYVTAQVKKLGKGEQHVTTCEPKEGVPELPLTLKVIVQARYTPPATTETTTPPPVQQPQSQPQPQPQPEVVPARQPLFTPFGGRFRRQ